MIKNKTKLYIALILWLIFFGVLIALFVLPFCNDLKRTSQELIFQKKAQQLFKMRLEDFGYFQKSQTESEETFVSIKDIFTPKEAPIEFIEFLEEQANKFNLSMKISPLNIEISANDFWTPIGFRIFSKASFPNTLKFLERLEQGKWLVEISQINIERIDEEKLKLREYNGSNIGDVSLSLIVKTFSYENTKQEN